VTGWNMPDGVSESMIPGNRPGDDHNSDCPSHDDNRDTAPCRCGLGKDCDCAHPEPECTCGDDGSTETKAGE
jgi:hypothetical protein